MIDLAYYATVITVDDYFNTTVSKVRIVGWTGDRMPVYERQLQRDEFAFIEQGDGSLVSLDCHLQGFFHSLNDTAKCVVEIAHHRAERERRNAEYDRSNEPDEPPF